MLTLLGAGFLLLLALSVLGATGRAPRVMFLGCAAAMGGLGLVGLIGLPATALPFGPPWAAAQIAVDALGGWFLLILALVAIPSCVFAAASPAPPRAEGAAFPLFLAGMALTLIAADAFTLVLGFELMSLASWALIAARHATGAGRRAARLYLGFAAFSGVCLIGAFALLASSGLGFAALRAAPPEGWRAGFVLVLVLLGAGSKAGLVPFHVWLPLAHPAAATPVSALMSGAMVKVALYVMMRVLLDLCGPAQPAWWGLPLILLGVTTALIGALRANLERDTKSILACSTLENMGLMVAALGLALAYRGADLVPLASVALAAALLHALNHAGFKTLLFLCIGAVYSLAGSCDPDRLGGLIHRMPWVAGCAMLGALSAAALPPLSGFASEWLLLQALIQAFRVSDMSVQLIAAASLAVVGMAIGLAAAAMVRLIGLVFLGRPRTPRGAGAPDATGLMRVALLLPAGLTLLLGPLAAVALGLLDGPIRQMLGAQAAAPRFGLDMALGDAGSRYMPGLVALLLALALAGIVLLVRRRSTQAASRGPAWDCGFMPPPPHLPFGDPLSQVSAQGLGQPIRRSLGDLAIAPREWHLAQPPGAPSAARLRVEGQDRGFTRLLYPLARGRRALAREAELLRGLSLRSYLALTFGTLVFLLALIAWLERG
ncbi:proton-conducting transporter membrane subunit [Sediminicoccus sp. KRV36]|uniref:proton-conducting transporter transmembrane domain-containing protein n=1 Tax=Sediminicoccus sp. KRV36 TaxID=3133721 RepID=UPI00200DB10A|nr:proton-conducting transporter membrane subunit [Sediminicoccus rosea]UPY36597.1 hydrogenase 4 subunit B [Sediminicoccus rosea]